jgi:hypothetical protein
MAHFNKRHYEAIALVCQEYRGHIEHFQTAAQRRAFQAEIEGRLADMFGRDNGLFKRDRFLAACLPGANVKLRTRYKVAV